MRTSSMCLFVRNKKTVRVCDYRQLLPVSGKFFIAENAAPLKAGIVSFLLLLFKNLLLLDTQQKLLNN